MTEIVCGTSLLYMIHIFTLPVKEVVIALESALVLTIPSISGRFSLSFLTDLEMVFSK